MSALVQSNGGAFATSRRGGLTPEEIRKAERLRQQGRGWQTIASIFGRCSDDIRAALEPKGLSVIPALPPAEALAERRRLDAEDRDRRFVAMWSTNTSVADIADHFDVSTVTINAWRVRLGLPSRLAPALPPSSPSRSKNCGAEATKIATDIANAYGLSLSDLTPPPSRAKRFSLPRQHIMSALVQQGYSLASIAALLQTDHATVIHGDRRHQSRLAA